MTKTMFFKIAGTALFTSFIASLFISLYHTDVLFSMTIATIWTVAYGINLYKENR
jgi:hypothetical protein